MGPLATVHPEIRQRFVHPAFHEFGKSPRDFAGRRGFVSRLDSRNARRRSLACVCWTIWTVLWIGAEAVRWLGLAIEAVVENYPEYVDYNSITTQSDRGDMLYTLLDFLRLRANYDRVAWNLRPILLTHEVLVRSGRDHAAEIWRKAVAERTDDIADDCLRRLRNMNKKYGMKLPSIAERLEERFIRPLQVDRLCAMVRPAMEELRDGRPQKTFPQLEKLVGEFTKKISGAGFETPDWLADLEDEAEQVQAPLIEDDFPDPYLNLPEVHLHPGRSPPASATDGTGDVKGRVQGSGFRDSGFGTAGIFPRSHAPRGNEIVGKEQ